MLFPPPPDEPCSLEKETLEGVESFMAKVLDPSVLDYVRGGS